MSTFCDLMLSADAMSVGYLQRASRPLEAADIKAMKRFTDDLSFRAQNAVRRLNATSIDELCRHRPDELLVMKSVGVTTLNEIRGKLAAIGRRLFMD